MTSKSIRRRRLAPGRLLLILPLVIAVMLPALSQAQVMPPGNLEDHFTFEAENWNFDGGMFIDDPVISFTDANSYVDKGATLGVPEVDYVENDPTTRIDAVNEWRIPVDASVIGLPQTAVSTDETRPAYDAALMDDYDLAAIDAGEWVNYTKTFPSGDFLVYGRFGVGGATEFRAELARVTSDASQAEQSTVPLGVFSGTGAGGEVAYGWYQLTDQNGLPLTVALSGEDTLRFTAIEGGFVANYFLLAASDVSIGPPSVSLTGPAIGSSYEPGADIPITAEASDADGSVTQVEFLATSGTGVMTSIGTVSEAPYQIVWQAAPEGVFDLTAVATDDTGRVASSSAVRVYLDNTPPTINDVRGTPTLTRVVVTFSEIVDAGSAASVSNFAIAGPGGALGISGASVSADGSVVILETDLQTLGAEYTITVNNIVDLAGNVIAANSQASFFGVGPIQQGNNGMIVFEAEAYDRNEGGLWIEDGVRGTPSGGFSMVIPNGLGGTEQDQLQYDINFTRTGTHIVWYRASGNDGSDDTAWLHFDGARPVGREEGNLASMTGFSGELDFVWRSNPQAGGGQMTFNVDTPGLHTVSIARREDGAFFDKMIIVADPTFVPMGFGPPESAREGIPVEPSELTITMQPSDASAAENASATFNAEATTTDGSFILYQWQSFDGSEWHDIEGAVGPVYETGLLSSSQDGTLIRASISNASATVLSDEVTLTVLSETDPPQLLRATGIGPLQSVVLTFSERLAAESVTAVGNYSITGPAGSVSVVSAMLRPDGVSVALETGAQTVGTKYTVTVSGVTDEAAVPNEIGADNEAKFYSLGSVEQNADGLIVFEAESYDGNSDGLWGENTERGNPSGGVSMVVQNGAGASENGTRLTYDILFNRTGTHTVWYRVSGETGGDDSSYLHLDGGRPAERAEGTLASMSGFQGTSDFVWRSNPQSGGGRMTVDIGSVGLHEIGLAFREDGAHFDKFIITTDASYTPTGFGPPETRPGAPALPDVGLDGLSYGDTFDVGATINLGAMLSPTDRVIERVDFLANGVKIGESTSAPFSFDWADVQAGVYAITAVATDDVKDTSESPRVVVIVGEHPNDILYLTGNADPTTASPSDLGAIARLEGFGFNVVVVDDNDAAVSDSDGKLAILNSSTVDAGNIGALFRDIPVPVLNWESANHDDFQMTGDVIDVDQGALAGQTEIEIVAAGHPMAAGLSAGAVTVVATPGPFSFGVPGPNASVVATAAGAPGQAVIFGYESGVEMMNGLFAPARRAGFFMTDGTFASLNDDGLRLFDAAVGWVLDRELTPGGGEIVITGITETAGQITITWEGGSGSQTVQRTDELGDAPSWSDVGTSESGELTLPIEGAAGFFRVTGP